MYGECIGLEKFRYFMKIIEDTTKELTKDNDTKTDINKLSEQIYEEYKGGRLNASQYVVLRNHISEIEDMIERRARFYGIL